MTIELVTEHLKLSEVMVGYPILIGDVMAEAADELLKSPSSPWRSAAEIPFTRKYFIEEKIEVQGLEPGQIRHWISTTIVDRDGEIMVPRGMDAKAYKKNPVVFWGHNYSEPENAIAKNLSLTVNDKGIMALSQFAKHNKAAMIYDLYAGEFLRAWSVGFIPIKGKRPPEPEKPEVPEGVLLIDFRRPAPGELLYTHEKWVLLEYSAVGVPANPEALTEQVAKGNIELSDRVLEEMQIKLEDVNRKKEEHGWRKKTYVFYDRDGGHEKKDEKVESEAEGEAKAKGAEAVVGATANAGADGEDPGRVVIAPTPSDLLRLPKALILETLKEAIEKGEIKLPTEKAMETLKVTVPEVEKAEPASEAVVKILPEPAIDIDALGKEVLAALDESTIRIVEDKEEFVMVTKAQLSEVVKGGLAALDEAGFAIILKESVDKAKGRV